jgi:2-(1,2-epoxy-1,2-dihydrophenyl)acetyl-CoA isomerase
MNERATTNDDAQEQHMTTSEEQRSAAFHQDEHLAVSLADGVLAVTIRNLARRNALNDASVAAFVSAIEQAQNNEAVRALLITGDGPDFCSGFDIVARNAGGGARPRVGAIQRRLPSQAHRLIPLLLDLQVPVVAAARGYAVGIGLQLLLASDFVIAADTALLWEPFAQRGMTPDGGASWLLPRVVGPLRARQMLILGQRLTGAEAKEWGIVHDCVTDGEVLTRASELAVTLAAGPTVTLGLTRWLANTGWERSLKEQLTQEALAMELSSRSSDFREGLTAFAEKRGPRFSGR